MSTKHHQPVEVVDGVYLCDKCGELGHKALDQMVVCGTRPEDVVRVQRFVAVVDDGVTPEGNKAFKAGPRTTTVSVGVQRLVFSEAQQGKRGSGGVLDRLTDFLVLAGWGTKK